ncbi:MAG: cyclase family protein [Planctomycetes bacterium]|nr:cyclase family protein [Planctomycetota bacterium]
MEYGSRTTLHASVSALLLAAGGWVTSCTSAPVLYEHKLVDLTHAFEDRTAVGPASPPFLYERDARRRDDGRWLATGRLEGSEFSGTHIVAPMHRVEGRHGTDEIPLHQLVGPIRVLDVRSKCRDNPRYAVDVSDLESHERRHGRVPRGAAVLVRTGWDQFWSVPERYFGLDDAPRHPGLSVRLVQALCDKGVDLVGVDGPSLEPVDGDDGAVARALGARDTPGLCNLTNLGELPPLGATLIALPMKIERGAGGPARVVAIVP